MLLRYVKPLLACFLLLFVTFNTAAQVAIPDWHQRVIDTTQTLTPPQLRQLISLSQQLQQDTHAQLGVLIVPTIGDESIESYATRVFEQWRLGQKGVDNGVLLVIALSDRKLRIEVGYGLEDAIPDVTASRIIREHITPQFKQGEYYQGIEQGMADIIGLISGNTPQFSSSANLSADTTTNIDSENSPYLFPVLIFIFTFMALFFAFIPYYLLKGITIAVASMGIMILPKTRSEKIKQWLEKFTQHTLINNISRKKFNAKNNRKINRHPLKLVYIFISLSSMNVSLIIATYTNVYASALVIVILLLINRFICNFFKMKNITPSRSRSSSRYRSGYRSSGYSSSDSSSSYSSSSSGSDSSSSSGDGGSSGGGGSSGSW